MVNTLTFDRALDRAGETSDTTTNGTHPDSRPLPDGWITQYDDTVRPRSFRGGHWLAVLATGNPEFTVPYEDSISGK